MQRETAPWIPLLDHASSAFLRSSTGLDVRYLGAFWNKARGPDGTGSSLDPAPKTTTDSEVNFLSGPRIFPDFPSGPDSACR
jgi:hypothetical protein